MTDTTQSFEFKGLPSKPVPSVLRGFSAPVIIERDTSPADRAFLMMHDTDPFNKWEAGRALSKHVLAHMVTSGETADPLLLDGLRTVLRDDRLDPAFRALALGLPSQDDLAQTLFDSGITPDPLTIYNAHKALTRALAVR